MEICIIEYNFSTYFSFSLLEQLWEQWKEQDRKGKQLIAT